MNVHLLAQIYGSIPPNNMVIVSDYALVEKIAGVFRSVCRSGSLPVLR